MLAEGRAGATSARTGSYEQREIALDQYLEANSKSKAVDFCAIRSSRISPVEIEDAPFAEERSVADELT
ncbi:hypothetical protein B1812_11765 [Methylocystis bryophila]|uniref:Uncharacterized protein n=1 Tax=Methylocystis bryophila TaxID=655015 RepID=A0A1W6MVP1_9HYPH|nr:hypothetical protein B1812_11765 [Methylocystis bryophila]